MRLFALSGAHGTGKTTLVQALTAKLAVRTPVAGCKEAPRVIAGFANDPAFFRRGHNTLVRQLMIFTGHMLEERRLLQTADTVISDRTLVDHLAYTNVLFPDFVNTPEWNVLLLLVRESLSEYNHIFKVPIEFSVADDGMREDDIDFQARVDKEIDQIYLSIGITTTAIGGTISERISQILSAFGCIDTA